MAAVAVIGERETVSGYALAGAQVAVAVGTGAVRDAWAALADDTVLVVLTARAAPVVAGLGPSRPDVLRVVIGP